MMIDWAEEVCLPTWLNAAGITSASAEQLVAYRMQGHAIPKADWDGPRVNAADTAWRCSYNLIKRSGFFEVRGDDERWFVVGDMLSDCVRGTCWAMADELRQTVGKDDIEPAIMATLGPVADGCHAALDALRA